MSYLQLRFLVQRDRADELSGALQDLGALSVTWENAADDAYFEVAYPSEPDWLRVCVTGLFESTCNPELLAQELSGRIREELVPRIEPLEDQDWERVWLERFQPRKYRGDLWVCPSWAEPPDPLATNLVLDPGLAFGTGDHATTALCLDWISECEWTGSTILDYGCGSGILAIACLLKGASAAIGVDLDPRALAAGVANAERNGVGDRYRALAPDEVAEDLRADLVVANILSSVLVELSGVLTRSARPNGLLLLSGILEEHGPEVESAYAPSFTFERQSRDGWCLLIGRKC